MRMWARKVRRLGGDNRGATIVEFAIVCMPLITIMIGLIDVGYREYVSVMLQGSLNEAARQVTVGGLASSDVTTFVMNRMVAVSPQATIVVTPKSYYDFSGVNTMEPITKDTNGNGQLDSGDCYVDYNNNKKRDTFNGTSGLGGSDDVIYYIATASFSSLVPVQKIFGWSGTETITASAMMRNQPYGAQATPTVCIS